MKNDIRIIFVDIDWTIFDHSKHPSKFDKSSIKFLHKLQKKGIKVFICTARPYHSVSQIKFFDLFKPDGMILANGGLIINDGMVIYETLMGIKEFENFCELALSHNVNVEGVRTYDCFLIAPKNKEIDALFGTYPEDIPPVEDYHNQQVLGCTLFAPKELDEAIIPKLPDGYHYFRYHDYGVDIASVPHEKGEAIKITLEKLGISKEHALAIGDDLADISMFENVRYSVAMGNAKEEVKENATFVTDTVTRHGVKRALKKLI